MSSSNLVRVAFIKESTYGVTPGSGNFDTARYTSESLSGTPTTTESQQIRQDRMSSGQVVTGLEVGGDIQFELAKESQLEQFMASAMFSAWDVKSATVVDLSFNAGTGILTRSSGNWASDGYVVGDFCTLIDMDDAENNVPIMLAELTGATTARIVGPEGMVTGTGTGSSIKRADKLTIGTTKSSFSIEKKFTDLTTKGIVYRGMIAASMELNVNYGELISGSFSFSGNDYATADQASELITDSRTVNAQATTNTMNGSIDMPFLATGADGSLGQDGLCIQSLSLTLNNNLSPQNCIGQSAPENYTPGTAGIEISMNTYLKDASWSLLGNKLSQTPFALGFMVKNDGGWYGFYLPAVQVSFDDPASGGANQDVSLEMSGTAKVGPTGESALSIYRSA